MKALITDQKLRGGYYTPKPVADFLARWAIGKPDTHILEPSCGDGNLLEAAAQTLLKRGARPDQLTNLIQAVEIDPLEASKAVERLNQFFPIPADQNVEVSDFFRYCKTCLDTDLRFDAVVSNPPFIRYQNFPEEHRAIAFYLMQRAGLHPNRLTNSWVPFLVAASLLLKDNGRLAMIIPAELLQVNYAAELRAFLGRFYQSITLVTFKKLVFDGIQQEVVLVLGERGTGEYAGIRIVELQDVDDLNSYEQNLSSTDLKEMDHSTEKWTMYFLDQGELELIRALKNNPKLTLAGEVLDVDVGIVTGLNDFFVLNQQQIEENLLGEYTHRIVGRSAQMSGVVFSEVDWLDNVKNQSPAFLFNSPDLPMYRLPHELKKYIEDGEQKGLNQGYKCRIRNRWYVVPSVWVPHAFMLRQIHSYPKMIVNNAAATCTDTIHRIKIRDAKNTQTITAAFLNSLTFAFSEILGRSYGGGVLELEPNEAEKLPLPLIGAEALNLVQIDQLLKEKGIEAVLDLTDQVLLREGLGLSLTEIRTVRKIWQKLRDRRINRKTGAIKNKLPAKS